MDVVLAPDRLAAMWRFRGWIAAAGLVGALAGIVFSTVTTWHEPYAATVSVALRSDLPEDRRTLITSVFRSDALEDAARRELGTSLGSGGAERGSLIRRIAVGTSTARDWVPLALAGQGDRVITVTARGPTAADAEQLATAWAAQGVLLSKQVVAARNNTSVRLDALREHYLQLERELQAHTSSAVQTGAARRLADLEQLVESFSDARAMVITRTAERGAGPAEIQEAIASFDRTVAPALSAALAELRAAQEAGAADTLRLTELQLRRDAAREGVVQETLRTPAPVLPGPPDAAVVANSLVVQEGRISWRAVGLGLLTGSILACTAAAVAFAIGSRAGRVVEAERPAPVPRMQPTTSASR